MNLRAKTLLSVLILLTLLPFSDAIALAETSLPDKPVGELSISELKKRAEAGDPVAENELGVRYLLGIDVEKDPAKAIPWFRRAAQQGNAKAYFNLGAAFYNGDGVATNDEESCVWFMLAADAGDLSGEEAIARTRKGAPPASIVSCEVLTASAYLRGELIKQDPVRAAYWFTKAAEAGNGLSCERLAYLYDRGLGVQQNKQKSIKWLKRSADLGYPPAIFELGMAYETGATVPKNLDKAMALYEQAAYLGQPGAMFALGDLYALGRGVKADRQEAFMFYMLAGDHGSADGKQMAEQLETKLTPEQIAAARQKALPFVKGLGNPDARVRAFTFYHSRVGGPYHPHPYSGTTDLGAGVYLCDDGNYGAMRAILLMKQSEAQQQGFRPYRGLVCP